MKRVGQALLRNIIVLALLEVVLRTIAAVGLISLPVDNQVENFDQRVNASGASPGRLYEPDRWTLNRLRADADITYPRHPVFPHGPETYRVQTNSAGMRDREITRSKPPGVIRIACLGDSSTFGYNVEVESSHPRRLQAMLDSDFPGRFQVLNFGIPGHTSLQGVESLKHKVMDFAPDVVTFAFGTNDRFWHGSPKVSEKLRFSQSWQGVFAAGARNVLGRSAIYRALRVLLARAGALKPQQAGLDSEAVVGLDEIHAAVDEVNRLSREHEFSVLVLNLDFQQTDAVQATSAAAHRIGATFLDMAQAFTEARTERALGFVKRLNLARTTIPTRQSSLILRVIVAEGRPTSISVRHHRFLDPNPKTEMMYDDGTHGDEHASDGVWSLVTPYLAGEWVLYSYLMEQEGKTAEREFRDGFVLNGIPLFGTAERKVLILLGNPHLDVYGEMYLLADAAHPNEEGQALIASRLYDAVIALPAVQRMIAQP